MQKIARALTLATLFAGVAFCDTIQLSILPTAGPLNASPGQVDGWGFSLSWTSATNWLTVIGSTLTGETNASLISGYTDFIGWQGGPTDYALTPNSTWTESAFDNSSQIGIGAVAVNESEPMFAQDAGDITVFYQVYSGDPTTNGSFISASSISVPFMVQVVAPSVPEPKSGLLLGFGVFSMLLMGRKLRGLNLVKL
jgi:hypothetical protein